MCNVDWSETSKCERQRQEKERKGSEGWADPRTDDHDDQKMIIKLGSNRVVEFDGRLECVELAQKSLCARVSKALSRRDSHTELLGLDMGVNCIDPFAVQGAKAKPGRELVGDPQNDLQPIRKMTKREMPTKRKILYGNNTVTNIIGSLSVTSSYRLTDPHPSKNANSPV